MTSFPVNVSFDKIHQSSTVNLVHEECLVSKLLWTQSSHKLTHWIYFITSFSKKISTFESSSNFHDEAHFSLFHFDKNYVIFHCEFFVFLYRRSLFWSIIKNCQWFIPKGFFYFLKVIHISRDFTINYFLLSFLAYKSHHQFDFLHPNLAFRNIHITHQYHDVNNWFF